MTNKPLFSVLIANYNNGKYLMDAINSVRQQTYTNWEIILVDDASTDKSHDLYKQLEQDERIHISCNEQNQGCGYTKYRCAELANGEYCGFLDPDDELLPDAVESMVTVYLNNPNVSIVMSRNFLCDKNMNVQRVSRLLDKPKEISYLEFNDFEAEAFVSYSNEYYKKSNKLNPNYLAGVDADLNFIMEEVGEIYVLDKVTYKYRRDISESITANNMKASFYNYIARQDAFIRRGKKPIETCFAVYEQCVNMVVNKQLNIQQREIRNSKTYRLGRMILLPIHKILNLFK